MLFRLLADITVLLHGAFVLFVVGGGLLVWRWPKVAWVHVPAAVWGAWVELAGWSCPLTPAENWLRSAGGEAAYTTSFVEHHLVPILYPEALSREVQWALGAAVIAINAAIYGLALGRRAGRSGRP